MTNREKVIHGLECLARLSQDEVCVGCPYFTPFVNNPEIGWCERAVLATETLALLKEQADIIDRYRKADAFLYAHGWRWDRG